jgi:hypothetical protein
MRRPEIAPSILALVVLAPLWALTGIIMATLLIQFGDIHFQRDTDPFLEKIDAVKKALAVELDETVTDCLILLTGDFAQTGDPAEFELTLVFITEIVSLVKTATNAKIGVLCVPGTRYNPGMSIVIPALGVAFAAFCVWLTVRIINRRKGDYFRPWRRKIGVMTLVMACVFAAGWVRSSVRFDSEPLTKPIFTQSTQSFTAVLLGPLSHYFVLRPTLRICFGKPKVSIGVSSAG